MIAKLVPSSLLHYEQVSVSVRTLLKRSRSCRENGRWMLAERCALDAIEICRHADSAVGLATAKLHLADIYQQVGELGRAMELCKGAYEVFNEQSAKRQRHNEAAAAYAQGLLHTFLLFGDDLQALHWYQKALNLFEEAQDHWAENNEDSRFKICKYARQYIEKQRETIIDTRSGGQVRLETLDILNPNSVDEPFVRKQDLRGRILDESHVEIGDTTYRLHSGALPSRDAEGAHYCFVLSVREQLWTFPAAQKSDYVIVRLNWGLDEEWSKDWEKVWMPGVVWTPDTGWDVGDFTITPDGKIRFHPCSMKVRIIGGEDIQTSDSGKDPTGMIKGHIVGLLKRDIA